SPVEGHVTFTNTGNVLVVMGRVTTTLRLSCGRCLEPVDVDLDVPVEEEFIVAHGEITDLADGDTGFAEPALQALIKGNLLNVTELVRQAIVLEEPGEIVCRDDCKGLCPHCGRNLNEGTCSCVPDDDSPFSALAQLQKQMTDN
ncbi:MAG TPA: DUF177 domain-containing protein, partial [Armatimonadota bacterium]|nr:DUF177 domain-containing protein [Armatimonadota bacterium]